jgi:hypothetical protein
MRHCLTRAIQPLRVLSAAPSYLYLDPDSEPRHLTYTGPPDCARSTSLPIFVFVVDPHCKSEDLRCGCMRRRLYGQISRVTDSDQSHERGRDRWKREYVAVHSFASRNLHEVVV